MKTSQEFVVGKHNIGWIDSNFIERVGDVEFQKSTQPLCHTLTKSMTDAEIEKEITKGRYATLGDVLWLLHSKNETYRDGYFNLFYFPSCVVGVRWDSGNRRWYVSAWDRDGRRWGAGSRVLSPATGPVALSPEPSDPSTLEARVEKLEEFEDKVRKFLIL